MMMILPFLKDRPISAYVCVDHPERPNDQNASRIWCRVARSRSGDLWYLQYALGLPVSVSIFDCERQLCLLYQPGEPPKIGQAKVNPTEAPSPYPPAPPQEPPILLAGISCYHRKWAGAADEYETWYSYEYAAWLQSIIRNPNTVNGTTVWRLTDVNLAEPPPELFSEPAIASSQRELGGNIWEAAGKFFGYGG